MAGPSLTGTEWQPEQFCEFVLAEGARLYRDLPWRETRDAYAVWISEAMLQQTQVKRVDGRWQRWLLDFPTLASLAAAPTNAVLAAWQGLGYNRRALNVQKAAQTCVALHKGTLPQDEAALLALPGIGPATAAGIRIFAYEQPALYLETNVRAVLLHYLYPGAPKVPDKELLTALVAIQPSDNRLLRSFYYALLDIGADLKKKYPNPSRRSATHARQSRYEGSHRQKRAELLRILLDAFPEAVSTQEAAERLSAHEVAAKRMPVGLSDTEAILEELTKEGFSEKVSPQREQIEVAWKCKDR